MTATEARADGPTTVLTSIAEKTGWRQISGPLFRKYVGLFLAVVCIALLSNGLFEILFSYREHTEALIRIQRERAVERGAPSTPSRRHCSRRPVANIGPSDTLRH